MKTSPPACVELPPRVFALGDGAGMTLQVMDVGATWLSCRVPVRGAAPREVLLGHAKPADHLHEPGYIGAIVGRYANRIAGARFVLDGLEHQLAPNEGGHQLHGGPQGFNRRRWQRLSADARHVRLALDSAAGDQGFPGALHAEVEYRVVAPGQVTITIDTEVSAPCPVNLTSHAYFNLDEHQHTVLGHRLRIDADHYLPVATDLIPTGELAPVQGTAFDLRTAHPIGEHLQDESQEPQQRIAGGFDHCYAVRGAAADAALPVAEAWSSDGRLGMTLSTSYPGLQFYSGNQLGQARGRDGRPFAAHAGFALEPQYFPDSPNRPHWPQPSCIQRPGAARRHVIRLCFADRPVAAGDHR
jgi:aldose 1-epimerase